MAERGRRYKLYSKYSSQEQFLVKVYIYYNGRAEEDESLLATGAQSKGGKKSELRLTVTQTDSFKVEPGSATRKRKLDPNLVGH